MFKLKLMKTGIYILGSIYNKDLEIYLYLDQDISRRSV